MISLEFLVSALIVVLIPGTGVIYTLSIALSCDRRSFIFASLGCTLGIVPHLILSIITVNFLISINTNILELIKIVGVGYLLYLAYELYFSNGVFSFSNNLMKKREIVLKGFLMNIFNIKLFVFLTVFIPQFINETSNNKIFEMSLLSFIFMLMTFIVFVFYGYLATYLKDKLFTKKKNLMLVNKIFSICLILLGLKLVFSF